MCWLWIFGNTFLHINQNTAITDKINKVNNKNGLLISVFYLSILHTAIIRNMYNKA